MKAIFNISRYTVTYIHNYYNIKSYAQALGS